MRIEVTCDAGIVKFVDLTLVGIKVYSGDGEHVLALDFSEGNDKDQNKLFARIWKKVGKENIRWDWVRTVPV